MRIECTGGGAAEILPALPPLGLTLVDDGAHLDCVLELSVNAESTESLDDLESDLGLFAAEHLRDLVAVHAALLARGDSAILLPGSSMTGKSTLAKTALDQGFIVAGDEYALIDPATGLAHSWPRPIHLRSESGWQRVDGTVDVPPVRIALVASLVFDDSVVRGLETVELTGGELVLNLLAHTICARTRPEDSLRAAAAIAQQARGIRGTRGEAGPALSELAALAWG